MAGSRSQSSGLRALRPEAFGADPSGERMARIRRSPHFRDGVFQNPGGAARIRPSGSTRDLAKIYFDKDSRSRRAPKGTIPVHPTTLADISRPPASGLRLTWMGHSSVLAEIDGHRVLFDPVWGERCSPFPFAGPKRLHPVPLPLAALGPVDVVVISHDHYDHLDLPTIKALAGTDTLFAVPSASARTWSAGACPPGGCASWTGTRRRRPAASPSPPPRPATSAAGACATSSTPCGRPGPSRARTTGSTTAATPATSTASGTSAPTTARSTPR
ncbi:hypothetical protein SHKM778_38440 [Streptomyces sp. KM77-8]|uniref:Metallo-beta-lactamase domain-containing protein n=1 Tax=Streptomyces haneummycinicus TaxID=3074435 RepID=A0AAT9HIX5_9ACTN